MMKSHALLLYKFHTHGIRLDWINLLVVQVLETSEVNRV